MKLDEISRNNHAKHTVFFWTNAFAEEALFFSDFGINFQYKEDTVASSSMHTPKEPSLRSVSFPSIKAVLEKKWVEIPSRFFPLSPTYVKSRILHKLK